MLRRETLAPALLAAAAISTVAVTAQSARVDFARQVQPILASHCRECHNETKRSGGLSLATYADALEGGRTGPVIRPGAAARSLVIHKLTGASDPRMPKDKPPLADTEIALIHRWIDEGARETPSSAPAPDPWEPSLSIQRPPVPAAVWTNWSGTVDRHVAAYLKARGVQEPVVVSDARFARRAFLDAWGLLPTPEQLSAFIADTSPDKRARLVDDLLSDKEKYAEHWISFWNDLLRNEDGVTYYSETAGRKSITDWLFTALSTDMPYDQFVSALINPERPTDPEGFLIGVNWRGETSAAVTPWMQASQNTAQVFLGINLKCNACHDSFVSRWKLKDAYALAAYFSPDPKLQLFRCDVAQNTYAEPAFLLPAVAHTPASGSLADRRAAAARSFTDPRNGRLSRTLVNRIWLRLFGRGFVPNADELDGRPWSPELLDGLATDFAENGYDVKALIRAIMTSRAYQMAAVPRTAESTGAYVFAGPEIRRLTAEQFADAIGAITGEWNVYPGRPATPGGSYGREWRVPSSAFTRALGRPIRDQVHSTRSTESSTLQALELVNGELYAQRLSRGARRMLGELPAAAASLFNRAVAGRSAASATFDIDVTGARTLWLIVQETGSNAPEVVRPAWMQAEFSGPGGVTSLASLTPRNPSPVRASDPTMVAVKNPSTLVYDIGDKGFTRFHGTVGLENPKSEIGSTLNPSVRFFVFDTAPDMEQLIPPLPALPLPAPPPMRTAAEAIGWMFNYALGRPPSQSERALALSTVLEPSSPRLSAEGLADLLWAITMKPEFQFIY